MDDVRFGSIASISADLPSVRSAFIVAPVIGRLPDPIGLTDLGHLGQKGARPMRSSNATGSSACSKPRKSSPLLDGSNLAYLIERAIDEVRAGA